MAFAPLAQTVILNDGAVARVVTDRAVIPTLGPPPASLTAGPTVLTDGTPSEGETFAAAFTAANSTGTDVRWILDGQTVATTPTYVSGPGSLRVGIIPKGPGGNGSEVISPAVIVAAQPRAFFAAPFFSAPFFAS